MVRNAWVRPRVERQRAHRAMHGNGMGSEATDSVSASEEEGWSEQAEDQSVEEGAESYPPSSDESEEEDNRVDWVDSEGEDEEVATATTRPAGATKGGRQRPGGEGGDQGKEEGGALWVASGVARALERTDGILAWNVGSTGLLHTEYGWSLQAQKVLTFLETILELKRPTWLALSEVRGTSQQMGKVFS